MPIMPPYKISSFFSVLPFFLQTFWSGQTHMRCLLDFPRHGVCLQPLGVGLPGRAWAQRVELLGGSWLSFPIPWGAMVGTITRVMNGYEALKAGSQYAVGFCCSTVGDLKLVSNAVRMHLQSHTPQPALVLALGESKRSIILMIWVFHCRTFLVSFPREDVHCTTAIQ